LSLDINGSLRFLDPSFLSGAPLDLARLVLLIVMVLSVVSALLEDDGLFHHMHVWLLLVCLSRGLTVHHLDVCVLDVLVFFVVRSVFVLLILLLLLLSSGVGVLLLGVEHLFGGPSLRFLLALLGYCGRG
jgi:hypothetical protein